MATSLENTKLGLQECLSIVQDVSRVTSSTCQDGSVLFHLLRLQPCLESQDLNAKDLSVIRYRVWKFDLIHLTIEELRNDHSNQIEGWKMLTNLSILLSLMVAGLKPKIPTDHTLSRRSSSVSLERINEYYDILLPTATDSILVLANNLLEAVERIQDDSPATTNFLECFKKVMDSLLWLCAGHKQCTSRALQSPYFLNILITDHHIYGCIVLTALESFILSDRSLSAAIPQTILNSILDELVYKLSGEEPEAASLSLRLLAQFSIHIPELMEVLCTTYLGLLTLVRKWIVDDQELGALEKQFVSELEARVEGEDEMTAQQRAAVLIQASWRGYSSRKKILRVKRGIQRFQQLYRKRKAEKLQKRVTEEGAVMEATLKKIHLKSSQLAFHENQMVLYEQLPASKLQSFTNKQENEAAVKIQSSWRRRLARTKFQEMKSVAKKVKSAVIIQRAFRHHATRKKIDKQEEKYEVLPALPGPLREKLQQEISRYRDTHTTSYKTDEQISQLHDRVQKLYEDFYFSRGIQKRQDEQIQLLISKLNRNCDLLLGAPSLEESFNNSVSVIETFTSKSSSIAKMARTAHREEMKVINIPWWKRPPLDHEELTL